MRRIVFFLLLAISILSSPSCDDNEPDLPVLAIRDFHEGSVLFYLDATGEHGLVSAVSEDSFEASWGLPLVVNGADGLTIGNGAQNTIDIVNTCSSSTSGFAADLCDKLELNCFDDWLLPSKVELERILFIGYRRTKIATQCLHNILQQETSLDFSKMNC